MKYEPLRVYMSNLPETDIAITLDFTEIELILNAGLPESASIYVEWWANESKGSQATSWLSAGFKVDSVELNRGLVRFIRDTFARNESEIQTTDLRGAFAHNPFLVEPS